MMEERKQKVDPNVTQTVEQVQWKPAQNHSYETMMLGDSELNCKIRPGGFRSTGRMRKIKNTCLLSKIKTKCRLKGKNPKMACCITMYNEPESELKITLAGVMHNYNELRNNPDFKKEDFLIFVIVDGYDKITDDFLKYATNKQFFDVEILKEKSFVEPIKGQPGKYKMKAMADIMDEGVPAPTNIIHMFMVTTWDFMEKKDGVTDDSLKARRVNFIFAIKQRNDGKINSHKWFFQGVCKYLKPELCLMLDIGTRPDKSAVYKLYNYMMSHEHCGGCCGEIEVDLSGESITSGSYFIRAAQFYEYKVGHTPDKANESFFGYNSVLPGAYSVFKWKAIQGDPLDEFFRNVNRSDDPTCAEANEYLAEDRVMCLQIYIKKKNRYYLTYVPEAKSVTDAPDSLTVLIKQRRRWMNGATFGTIKVISHAPDMVSCSRTTHPIGKDFLMILYLAYYTTNFLLQFFSVGAMYAAFSIFFAQCFSQLAINSTSQNFVNLVQNNVFSQLFDIMYIGLIFMTIVLSLTIPVERGIVYFNFLMVLFGLLMTVSFIATIMFLAGQSLFPEVMVYNASMYPAWKPQLDDHGNPVTYFSWLVLCGIIMMVVYLIPIILRPVDFLQNVRSYIIGLLTYLFMMPTFINVMSIYSMCNLHDISWGNRPSTGQGIDLVSDNVKKQEKLKVDYQVFRALFLYMWLTLNIAFAVIMVYVVNTTSTGITIINGEITFLTGFALFYASLVMFKFTFASLYQVLLLQILYNYL